MASQAVAPASPEAPDAADQLLLQGVLAADRRELAKLITLIESTRPEHRRRADVLMRTLLPRTGGSVRLGVSGAPGAGKSTLIEALGLHLVAQGQKVAVLAIDPSSSVNGGSILADKTRMPRLAASERGFIRPSPSSGTLGGVASCTRETLLACEAAGFDVVIVETVGVGQSETTVATMVDHLLLLQLPNAGDDLQAIKRGVMELSDVVAVNKADLDISAAGLAAMQISASRGMTVHCVSALEGSGIPDLWAQIRRLHDERTSSGSLADRRQRQALAWMWDLVHAGLKERFLAHPGIAAAVDAVSAAVCDSRMTPRAAAHDLLDRFAGGNGSKE